MSCEPAHIFALKSGNLKVGAPADVTIIDLNKEWTVDKSEVLHPEQRTPFEGKQCKGKAVATIVAGKLVMRDGVVCKR
jgi:dihydroorotase